MASFDFCMPASNQPQNELAILFKLKSEALSSMESIETEEETFSLHNSTAFDYSEDSQSESTDIEEEDEDNDCVLISSRSDNQFTPRLIQQIQKLSENKIFNQMKSL